MAFAGCGGGLASRWSNGTKPDSFARERATWECYVSADLVEGSAGNSGSIGRPLFRIQAGLIGFLCFSAAAFPRLLPAVLGLLALAAVIHILKVDPKRPLALLLTPVGIALGAFIVYLFINAAFAVNASAAFSKAGAVLGLVACAFLIASSFTLHGARETRGLAKWALIGLLLGVAFLLIEIVWDEPVKLFVTNNIVQMFDFNPKKTRVVDGELTKLKAFILNRNVTSLVLLLIPGLLFTRALAKRTIQHAALAALLSAAAACVLMSESGTSVAAFFAGALVLALSVLSLKAARVALMTAWTVAMLFAVPLAALPYDLGWNRWTWVPASSVGARLYIWKHMADEVWNKPVTGLGIRGARTLKLQLPADLKTLRAPVTVADGRRVPHPHNVFLQIWLELGAIGALLALGLGLVALWQIGTLPALVQAGAYGLFAVSAVVGASGFDLWQTWLFGSYVFAWAAILLAERLGEVAPRPRAGPCA
jgi:exopolysaccharide production protein ExoQ